MLQNVGEDNIIEVAFFKSGIELLYIANQDGIKPVAIVL